jgi:hypothetical protein
LRFPNWQRDCESVLLETDKSVLFKRVEVAEAASLTRRDALEHDSSGQTERVAIEDALANRRVLKRDQLHFGETEKRCGFFAEALIQTSCTGGLYDWRSNYSHVLLNSGKTGRVGKEERSSNACQLSFSPIFCIFTHLARVGGAWEFEVVACKERNGQ